MLVFDLFILRPRLRNVLISWILGWVLLRQCVHWVSALLFSGFNEFWGRWEWKSRFTCDWAWSGLEFVGLVPNRCGGAKHSLESRKNAEKWVHGPYSFPSCTALWPQFSMENRFPNLALYSCTSWSNRIMSLGPLSFAISRTMSLGIMVKVWLSWGRVHIGSSGIIRSVVPHNINGKVDQCSSHMGSTTALITRGIQGEQIDVAFVTLCLF